jgi:GxxExxY protein
MQRDPETFTTIGAAMEVHGELGDGFLELVYQTALALEFQERGIPYAAEVTLPINYKSKLLTCVYRSDFFCFNSVIICENLRNLWTTLLRNLPAKFICGIFSR